MSVCRQSSRASRQRPQHPGLLDGSRETSAGEKPRPWRDLRNLARLAGLLSAAGAAGVKEKGWLEEIL